MNYEIRERREMNMGGRGREGRNVFFFCTSNL